MAGMASRRNRSSRALLLLGLAYPLASVAGDWRFSPGLTLSQRYSDNVNLDVKGAERSEWITELTPGFTLARQGGRLKANLDYGLQGLYYADEQASKQARHRLNGRLIAELIEDRFFIDASARVSNEVNTLSGGVGVGDAVGLGNTSRVASYSLSPYLKHRFGSVASLEARLTLDGVLTQDAAVSNANSTRYQLRATSGTAQWPLSWSLDVNHTETDNDDTANSSDTRFTASARYALTPRYGLVAQAGKEEHDFSGVGPNTAEHTYYGLGAYYQPGRRFAVDVLFNYSEAGNFISAKTMLRPTLRTTLNASTTRRAYGRSNNLSLAHRTRHSNWSLRYQDDLTTSQRQYLNLTGFYLCLGADGTVSLQQHPVGLQPADCVQVGGTGTLVQGNDTYVSKSLVGAVSYSLRRNTWTLSLYDNRREFQLGGTDETTRGVQASWSLRPVPRTNLVLSGGLSRHEYGSGGVQREDDLWNLTLTATRQFQPKVSGSVELRRQERESKAAGGDYAENSIAARVNMSF